MTDLQGDPTAIGLAIIARYDWDFETQIQRHATDLGLTCDQLDMCLRAALRRWCDGNRELRQRTIDLLCGRPTGTQQQPAS
jgi:hypothetical protein